MPLIIDTDASFDVDDVVAICMAHALMDAGEVEIKVMGIDLLSLERHLISPRSLRIIFIRIHFLIRNFLVEVIRFIIQAPVRLGQ